MKYFNAMLFVFTVTNVYTAAADASCKEVTDLFNIINGKLDTMIKIGGGGPVCKPFNFQNLQFKLAINDVSFAFGAVADGNDVYITSYSSQKLYHFNQVTTPGKVAVSVVFPTPYNPVALDIKDGFLYMTAHSDNVYRKNLRKAGSSFEKIITIMKPFGIHWSPDGNRLFVSESYTQDISVYNANFQFVTKFQTGVIATQTDISFDSNGNIRISFSKNEISIFDKNTYKLIETKIIANATNIVGLTELCDGSIIVADMAGTVLFLNENYDTLETITGYRGVGDVAITEDGILYVTGSVRSGTIFLYDLF